MSQFESQFEENLYQLRREKRDQIAALARSVDPGLQDADAKYPNTFRFTHTVPNLRAIGDPKSTEELEANRIEAAIAGRIMAIRVQGKAGFAQIQQGGQRLQIYVRKDDVGETLFAMYKLLDLGDHVGVRGYLMRTRTGELTLHAQSLTFLTKAMLALPDKYHGLEDVETRYRQRYVDLIVNSGTRDNVAPLSAAPSNTGQSNVGPLNLTPLNPILLSSRSEAKGSASPAAAPALTEAPGSSAVTDHAADNEQHNDAPIAPPEGAGGFSPLNTPKQTGALAPGSSAVTDHAADNEQHNDAPINVREVFVKRAAILRAIRKFFDERDYLEVETPMLHTVAGGAAARPFKTHHNTLDIPLSLRIAPELYLKRLVVGGLDRVYEINRNFRNEGVSTRHNPEFTMLEFYQAYANYHDLMELTEELIKSVAIEVNGTTVTHFNGQEIDLGKWRSLSMRDAIKKFWPPYLHVSPSEEMFSSALELSDFCLEGESAIWNYVENGMKLPTSPHDPAHTKFKYLETLASTLHNLKMPLLHGLEAGKAVAEIFEAVAEPHLIQPTIIYDFPLAVSPLSKVKPDEPDWVERFEFYIGGFEVGNAFSELNDPDDQRARFLAQVEQKERGDEEAMAEIDEDYVRALGYGLPPTAGEGIGIDRLTMLLTGSRSIRDVILFPLMRPLTKTPDEPTEEHGESSE